jgi:PAS domain S-box-containing protein
MSAVTTDETIAGELIRIRAQIFDAPGQAVIGTALDGRIVYWSEGARALYGWSADEALERPVSDLVVPQLKHDHAERIMDRLRSGMSWTGSFPVRSRDGSTFIALVHDSPVKDSEGNLVGILGISSALER